MFKSGRKSVALWLFVFPAIAIFALPPGTVAQTNTERVRQAAVTPEKLSASFAEAARAVEPAVVNIDTKTRVPEITIKGDADSEKWETIPESTRRRRANVAVGSGFIVDKSGYIITNAHVIEDAARIFAQLASGEEFVARVVGVDEETDIAVLKIEAGRDLPFLNFADSEAIRVGDWVLAVGSPFGLAQTVTAGIVSQVKRETPSTATKPFQKFIQTDAAINRGNSGGPLVNMDGEVVGVNSQIATSTGDYNGIGFALPSNEARRVYRQIIANGRVRRGYLGVNLDTVKTEFAKVYGLPEARGAIITNISDKQSAAALGGLLAGDIVLEFNGLKVGSAQDLIEKVAAADPESEAEIVLMREAGTALERKTIRLRLGERPAVSSRPEDDSRRSLPVDSRKEPVKPFGLTLQEMTPTVAAAYRLDGRKGLVVKSISPASFISDVRSPNGDDALQEGDVIVRINRVEVVDLKTFNEIVGRLKTGDAVVLHVLGGNGAARVFQPKIVQFTIR